MKPLIIGLNNPLSARPADALLPWPTKATGFRLLELIRLIDPEFSMDDYLDAFERTNVWPGRELPSGRGRANQLRSQGRKLLEYCTLEPRSVALLGAQVWASVLDRDPPRWFECQLIRGSTFYFLPHPSGANRLFNEAHRRAAAGRILLALATPVLQQSRRSGEVRAI